MKIKKFLKKRFNLVRGRHFFFENDARASVPREDEGRLFVKMIRNERVNDHNTKRESKRRNDRKNSPKTVKAIFLKFFCQGELGWRRW